MSRDVQIKIIQGVLALALLGAGLWSSTQEHGSAMASGLIAAALGLVALLTRSPLSKGAPKGEDGGAS